MTKKFVGIKTESAVGGAPWVFYEVASLAELCDIARDVDRHLGIGIMQEPLCCFIVIDQLPDVLWDVAVQFCRRNGRLCWLDRDGTTEDV